MENNLVQGHIMIVDMLGFSNININLSDADLQLRINEWVKLTTQAAKSVSIDRFSMLSDTIFAATDGSVWISYYGGIARFNPATIQ